MSLKERKSIFKLEKIGDKKLSEITIAEFLKAMPYIDTVPLPEGDLGAVKVKELVNPKFREIWRAEKKKIEREVAFEVASYHDIELSKTITNIEERLANIEEHLK